MGDSHFFHNRGREDARDKGSAENITKLVVEPTNSQVFEIKIGLDDRVYLAVSYYKVSSGNIKFIGGRRITSWHHPLSAWTSPRL
jgi:hypothetical protein